MEKTHIEGDMNTISKWSGPVAIGGVGGSGTRIVAEILKQLGFYMGEDINSANDNLWFTLLFKRPRWFLENLNGKKSQISNGLCIFEKAMTVGLSPKYDELTFIIRAAVEMMFKGHDHMGSGRGLWPIMRAITLLRSKKPDSSRYIGWGWKEPNTHIYIEHLSGYFHNLKYIHVMRHGLDMAYSSNQAQLFNWGKIFEMKVQDSSTPLPKLSLRYWIEANKRVISLCKKLLNERFLVINFDRLCLAPKREIGLLIDFLELDIKEVNTDNLVSLPKIPNSMGRYIKYDTSIFSKEEIKAVQGLGFEVNISHEEEH